MMRVESATARPSGRFRIGRLPWRVLHQARGKYVAFNQAIDLMRSGLSEAVGDTPLMQLQKLQNSLGDAQENIGLLVSSTRTWQAVLKAITGGVEDFSDKIEEHTHHPADSSGSSCYNCHMPHTSYALFSAMRSHRVDRAQRDVHDGRPRLPPTRESGMISRSLCPDV